jgi:PilZ domain
MEHQSGISPERRSAERFQVSLPVETNRGPGMTRDVSVSGLYLVIEQSLKDGDQLELSMDIPDSDHPGSPASMRIALRGRVVRVEEVQKATGAGIVLEEGSRHLSWAS